MIYGAGCNIEFDCWKPRCSGKVDDVRGIRTRRRERARIGRRRTYPPPQIWDIRLTSSDISLTPGDSPPSLRTLSDSPDLIIYIIPSGTRHRL